MDLYLFDFDETLHSYDFRQRLPALAVAHSGANVQAALEIGMHAHHFTEVNGQFQLNALNRAIDEFAGRNR